MWTYLPASPDVYQTREGFHRWMLEALAATAAASSPRSCRASARSSASAWRALASLP